MHIQELPVEVLIIIIKKLDLPSVRNLYNTCGWIRKIICMEGIIKTCNFSRNVLATIKTFKLPSMLDISRHAVELNLRGVPDLTKTALVPALKKFTSLQVLDIAYTGISFLDLIDIKKACPTITDITTSYLLLKPSQVTNAMLYECQKLFAQFTNIHFVGSYNNLLYSKMALYILAKAKIHNLKYTVAGNPSIPYMIDYNIACTLKFPKFDHFCLFLLNWKFNKPLSNICDVEIFPVMTLIDFNDYNYLIILVEEFEPKVYASPVFRDFLKEKFNVTSEYIPQTEMRFYGSMAFMFWNKETYTFDDSFFNTLAQRIKSFFPYYFLLHSEVHVLPAPKKYDWFYTIPVAVSPVPGKYKDLMRGMNKKRLAAPNYVLNYDGIFTEKDKVELSLIFKYPTNTAIALTPECNYLSKLTFFNLVGFGRYSSDFFNILFRCCENLVTLNIQSLPVAPCASAVARSLPLSKTLKNLRLVDKRVDFNALFMSFTQCPTLENINLVDESVYENNELGDPTPVVENCHQIHSLYIQAQFSESTRTKLLQRINKARATFNRHHLYVKLDLPNEVNPCIYDAFIEVFRLNPIKPV